MVSHRPYTTGFYFGDEPGQHTSEGTYASGADVVAVVESCEEDGYAVVTQRNKFEAGEELELLTPEGEPVRFTPDWMLDADGGSLLDAPHPMMEVHLQLPKYAPRLSILRKCR